VKITWFVATCAVGWRTCESFTAKPAMADLIFVLVTVLAFVILTLAVRAGQRL